VRFIKDRQDWAHLDPGFEAEFTQLGQRLDADGEITLDRTERDDRTWLVSLAPSDGPVSHYRYRRDTAELTFLFHDRPELSGYQLARMEPFAFIARDGLRVHGYLTYPPGVQARSLPAVLDVHGGPWGRNTWRYDEDAQWLANRGYACVQVNFRGSTGYGKAFVNAGNKQWGRTMHTDLLDAIDHLASSGTIDPSRVAIMGGSYGGYAALAGAAFTPDVFRCAIDLCGPANLLTLLASIPPYWRPVARMFHTRMGDPVTEKDMLAERSPLSAADQIKIPVLVAQGANDVRVKQAEAEQIVAAMRRNGVPHEYLLFGDEGHGLARPKNRERYYAAAERFLAEHLGGRMES
jgi:dipeptidyl aminopeptidase/acylaminoacyl peptidase